MQKKEADQKKKKAVLPKLTKHIANLKAHGHNASLADIKGIVDIIATAYTAELSQSQDKPNPLFQELCQVICKRCAVIRDVSVVEMHIRMSEVPKEVEPSKPAVGKPGHLTRRKAKKS